jgi:hypothetical protein
VRRNNHILSEECIIPFLLDMINKIGDILIREEWAV